MVEKLYKGRKICKLMIIVMVVLSLCACSNKEIKTCEQIAKSIECGEYQSAAELSKTLDGDVSAKGKEIVMNVLVERINSQMTITLTSFFAEDELIDDDVIQRFECYKEILDNLVIAESFSTNIVRYVDNVLSTAKYTKYEALWCLVNDVYNDMSDADTNFNKIHSSYSSAYRRAYAIKARDAYEQCYKKCLNYDENSFGVKQLKAFFLEYVNELSDYLNGGTFNANEKLAKEWGDMYDVARKEWDELTEVIDSFPLSVYYGK